MMESQKLTRAEIVALLLPDMRAGSRTIPPASLLAEPREAAPIFPTTRGPRLETVYQDLPSPIHAASSGVITEAAASPDGTAWLGVLSLASDEITMSFILCLPPGEESWMLYVVQLDSTFIGLAPRSQTEVYALIGDTRRRNAQPYIFVQPGEDPHPLGTITADEQPEQISAADGLVWVRCKSGAIFEYDPRHQNWHAVDQGTPSGQLGMDVISLGKRDFILGQRDDRLYEYSPGSRWREIGSVLPKGVQLLAACTDGCAWLVADDCFLLKTPFSGWNQLQRFDRNENLPWVASGCRDFIYTFSPNSHQATWLAVGLANRPPEPWPEFSQQQRAIYNWISEALGFKNPEGIRAQYDSMTIEFSALAAQVANTRPPRKFSRRDWETVTTQIITELRYAGEIRNLFDRIDSLLIQIQVARSLLLPVVAKFVDIENAAGGGKSRVEVFFDRMHNLVMGQIIKSVAGPAAPAVSLAMDCLLSAAKDDPDLSPDGYRLLIAYDELADKLLRMHQADREHTSRFDLLLRTDWGRMRMAGELVASGVWSWPRQDEASLVKNAEDGLRLSFFQALMPARWQIVYLCHLKTDDFDKIPNESIPWYAAWNEIVTIPRRGKVVNWYWCSAVGASHKLNDRYLGPYPEYISLNAVWDATPSLPEANAKGLMYKSLFGWQLPRVPVAAGKSEHYPCRTS